MKTVAWARNRANSPFIVGFAAPSLFSDIRLSRHPSSGLLFPIWRVNTPTNQQALETRPAWQTWQREKSSAVLFELLRIRGSFFFLKRGLSFHAVLGAGEPSAPSGPPRCISPALKILLKNKHTVKFNWIGLSPGDGGLTVLLLLSLLLPKTQATS